MKSQKPRPKRDRPPDLEAVDTGWRLFISVPIPDEVKALSRQLIDYAGGRSLPVRWVNTEYAHITLHFLGDTEPERAALIRSALPATVANIEPFVLQTGLTGVFPNPRQPRVLWLGLGGQIKTLELVHRSIGEMLKSLDVEIDDRPLRPHITLGRARDEAGEDFTREVNTRFLDPSIRNRLERNPLDIPVTHVALMRSYLGKQGARHIEVSHANLAGIKD